MKVTKVGALLTKNERTRLKILEERRLDPSLRWDKRGLRFATTVNVNLGEMDRLGKGRMSAGDEGPDRKIKG